MDSHLDSSDDNKPLPELSFEDFMDPEPETSGQHMEIESYTGDTSQEDDSEGDGEGQHDANDSLNTPQFKKTVVQILEDKRITAGTGAGGVFKTHAIKVVTAGANSAAKSQSSDIRILNSSLKPVGQSAASTPLKIGSTSIASTSSPRQLGGVTMTQFKTADGRVLYLKKAPAAGTGGVVAGKASVSPVSAKVGTAGNTPGTSTGTAIRRVVNTTGIQKAVLAKGMTVAGTGLVKAAVPSGSSATAITIKGITPLAAETNVTGAPSPPASSGTKIQVVRTADGKLIKLGQNNNSPVVLNTKAPISGASATSTPSSNMIINKSASGQVVIKPSPTSSSAAASNVPGKMVVQSGGGTQIMVSTKNIIKLSPKPGATSTVTQTQVQNTPSSSSTTTPTSGMRTIQLSGKSGVQFVRVMTNNKSLTTAKSAAASTPSQKQVPQSSSASPAVTSSTPVGNTNKIVMRTMGGSIVPLPSMKTLVPKRALGANSITAATPNNQESLRKHRLNDLNVQLKNLGNVEASDSSDAGPDTKKPRFSQPSPIQRVLVKEGGPNTSSSSAATQPKKIYNLVKSAGPNGSVKYVICNSNVARSSMSPMRRGYTGYVRTDGKLCRTLVNSGSGTTGVTNLKQLGNNLPNAKALQAQAQIRQRARQQHLQQLQKAKPQLKGSQLNQSANVKPVPAPANKPNFEILKPPSSAASTPAVDAQLNLASRRKHCNCSKSQCLKLYCDCFANGEFCKDCTCKDCFNNLDNEVEREKAIRSCLDRNPSAFKPKITAPASGDMRLHNKGCNCKRSGCLKNYCECYEAKIPCSSMCKCVGCRNMEDRPDVDMDSLDSLLGVRKPNKPKDETATKKHDIRSNLYLTDDVIEATIMCMISRILMHEKQNMPIEATEREVMEELGESLNQIITFAKEKNENNTTTTSRLDDTTKTTKTDA
ncbi:protein lin-54 homolog isoform X2 [Drosophila willistoni]|uniref:protein lin-54 homolog isoform X2 n=1 Tax=Drosophila willistoni TaxID=7260 RepID=UPI001F086359|nr:protein lin-54 homolog isoform X2 [Drosophila willistoni]